jgi:adenosine deaminase CECR1
MGVLCSTIDKDGDDPPESKAQDQAQPHAPRRLQKMPQIGRPWTRSQQSWEAAVGHREFETLAAYTEALKDLQLAESSIAFDAEVTATASKIEARAAALLKKIRASDWENIYGPPFDAQGHATGKRTEGEHFLGNVDLINRTKLMEVARQMPKGAHLHIHFNSCLPGKFLIQQARNIDAMYIRSTLPLTSPENMATCRISFMVMTPHEATHTKSADGIETHVPLGNIWGPSYIRNTWMPYKQFQQEFKFEDKDGQVYEETSGAEMWLERKMLISEEEAHGTQQTGRG